MTGSGHPALGRSAPHAGFSRLGDEHQPEINRRHHVDPELCTGVIGSVSPNRIAATAISVAPPFVGNVLPMTLVSCRRRFVLRVRQRRSMRSCRPQAPYRRLPWPPPSRSCPIVAPTSARFRTGTSSTPSPSAVTRSPASSRRMSPGTMSAASIIARAPSRRTDGWPSRAATTAAASSRRSFGTIRTPSSRDHYGRGLRHRDSLGIELRCAWDLEGRRQPVLDAIDQNFVFPICGLTIAMFIGWRLAPAD